MAALVRAHEVAAVARQRQRQHVHGLALLQQVQDGAAHRVEELDGAVLGQRLQLLAHVRGGEARHEAQLVLLRAFAQVRHLEQRAHY
jgi:hypothetical protein